jgi:peptidyl-prolyl cis-trans isomerase SurA
VSDLPVDQPSPLLRVADGVSVIVVCDRQAIGIDREEIRERLLRERLELMAQRYMRDLRRAANVDIRI